MIRCLFPVKNGEVRTLICELLYEQEIIVLKIMHSCTHTMDSAALHDIDIVFFWTKRPAVQK